jgi:CheY-like chemotaxis protein
MARIAICEPSTELRHLFEVTVARLGHEPALCGHPEKVCPPADAMLVDVDDGIAAGAAAEARHHTARMPVIVCSIYPRDERSDALHPVAHLLKPFSRPELERAITEALGGGLGTMGGCPPIASAPTAESD